MQSYPNYSQPMMNSPYQNGYSPMLSPQQRLIQMEQQYPQFSQQESVCATAYTAESTTRHFWKDCQ